MTIRYGPLDWGLGGFPINTEFIQEIIMAENRPTSGAGSLQKGASPKVQGSTSPNTGQQTSPPPPKK